MIRPLIAVGATLSLFAQPFSADAAVSIGTVHTQGDSATIRVLPDTTVQQRPNFFHRFYRYFADSNEDKTLTKTIDFSVIGGPHYSSDIGFGIGLVAAGLYRLDKSDLTLPPSNVSFTGDITTTGFFMLGIRGNTYFPRDRFRINYTSYFFSMPSDFWGIGYQNGRYAEKSTYKRLQTQLKVDFMWRLMKNTYLGTNVNFAYIEGKNFSNPAYLEGQRRGNVSYGPGAFILYDSRDFIPNAWRGLYAKIEHRLYPEWIGNKMGFSRTELFFDAYRQVWKGGVLAYDLHAISTWGDVSWTQLASMGGSTRMRGYYEGRYRDRNLWETQLELRQKIYGRNGVAVWAGAGNVFHSYGSFDWDHTLPNFGFGYRWEFKKRVNVRLDLGFGKKTSGFIFNIDEAF